MFREMVCSRRIFVSPSLKMSRQTFGFQMKESRLISFKGISGWKLQETVGPAGRGTDRCSLAENEDRPSGCQLTFLQKTHSDSCAVVHFWCAEGFIEGRRGHSGQQRLLSFLFAWPHLAWMCFCKASQFSLDSQPQSQIFWRTLAP